MHQFGDVDRFFVVTLNQQAVQEDWNASLCSPLYKESQTVHLITTAVVVPTTIGKLQTKGNRQASLACISITKTHSWYRVQWWTCQWFRDIWLEDRNHQQWHGGIVSGFGSDWRTSWSWQLNTQRAWGLCCTITLSNIIGQVLGDSSQVPFWWFTNRGTSALSKVRVYTRSRGNHKCSPAHSNYHNGIN